MRRFLAALACLALLTALLPASVLAAAPTNDNWADAALITGTSGSVSGNNAEATLETNEVDHLAYGFHSVWYHWNPGRKDLVTTFTTCDGATWDTVLDVVTGTAGPPDWSDIEYIAGNDDVGDAVLCNRQSRVTFIARAGQTYTIRMSGYYSDPASNGAFTLYWTTVPTVRGTLSVSLTNTSGDAAMCTMVVKGSGLAPDQNVVVGNAEYVTSWDVYTLPGRWTSDPVYLDRLSWNVQAAGELYLWYDVVSADGASVVTAKITNRCKPAL